jgi:hypothetical protein
MRNQGIICGNCRQGPTNIEKMLLHNTTIRSRVARCSYGILLGIPWESSQSKNESDKYQDLCTGRWFSREIKWLLKRVCVSCCFRFPFLFPVPLKQRQLGHGLIILQGENIAKGRTLTLDFDKVMQVQSSITNNRMICLGDYEFEDQLLYSEVDNPSPSYNDRVNVLCRLPFSIPKATIYAEQPYKSPINRTKWRRVRCRIEVVLKSAALEFQLTYKDQLMGSVEAQYVEC